MIGLPAGGARRRRTWRRRLALGLMLYGVTGLTLAVASLLAIGATVGSLDALMSRRADAVRWLDLAASALDDTERSTTGAAGGLVSAAASARSAASLFTDLSSTMAGLRDASSVSILGTQPLGAVTDELDRVAGRSATLADEMGTLAGALATEKVSLDQLAADTGRLRTEVRAIRDELAATPEPLGGPGGLGALLVLVVAWLALPSVVSLGLGIHQLRQLSRPRRRSSRETVGAW